MLEIILATSNLGKVTELQSLLFPIRCMTQSNLGIEDTEETGLSFLENALIKARHASKLGGRPALADDSGLVVPALDGQPGIYSARFAGEHATSEDNIKLLLQRLANVPDEKRVAYFYCAIALLEHAKDPTPLIATGKLTGSIAKTPKGTHGFGYDSIFYLPEYQCTVAELPATIKNKISHRAIALKQLRLNL